MNESIENNRKIETISKIRKYIDFGKLVVTTLSIYFVSTILVIMITPEDFTMKPIYESILFLLQIFKHEGKIDANFIWNQYQLHLHAIFCLILLFFYQKYIRKKSLHDIGIKNLRGELGNIILSIIGSFLILSIVYYYIVYLPSIDLYLFVKLIPFTILGEIVQEIIFRGMILMDAMEKFGKWKGIFYTSIIFSLTHITTQKQILKTLILTFLVGIWWGYLFSKNRNIASPVIGHIFMNILILSDILGETL